MRAMDLKHIMTNVDSSTGSTREVFHFPGGTSEQLDER